jgi:hypothetical protein
VMINSSRSPRCALRSRWTGCGPTS